MVRIVAVTSLLAGACGPEAAPVIVSLNGPDTVVVEHLGPLPEVPTVHVDGRPTEVVWTMDPQGVASIHDGTIAALSPGEVIFRTESHGQILSWSLSVDPEVMIRFVDPPTVLISGESAPLMLHGEIDGAPMQPIGVSWISSDERVAKVTTGHVTARRPGVTWITAATRHAEAVLELEVVLQASDAE